MSETALCKIYPGTPFLTMEFGAMNVGQERNVEWWSVSIHTLLSAHIHNTIARKSVLAEMLIILRAAVSLILQLIKGISSGKRIPYCERLQAVGN